MIIELKIEADKIDQEFLNLVRSKFKGKTINIFIDDKDETEYLEQSSEMKKRLTEASKRDNIMSLDEVNERLGL